MEAHNPEEEEKEEETNSRGICEPLPHLSHLSAPCAESYNCNSRHSVFGSTSLVNTVCMYYY